MNLINKYELSRRLFGHDRKLRTTGKTKKPEHIEAVNRLESMVEDEIKIIKLELTENQSDKEKE